VNNKRKGKGGGRPGSRRRKRVKGKGMIAAGKMSNVSGDKETGKKKRKKRKKKKEGKKKRKKRGRGKGRLGKERDVLQCQKKACEESHREAAGCLKKGMRKKKGSTGGKILLKGYRPA